MPVARAIGIEAMAVLMQVISVAADTLAAGGMAAVAAGVRAVGQFASSPVPIPARRPPVSILTPLYGSEPLLDAALTSLCAQEYRDVQLVFGVQHADDPAVDAVERVRARFPHREITLVADQRLHGRNRKISNLINMLPSARHDILVMVDSDLHVAADYLDHIVGGLEQDGVGLVTTVCAGMPTSTGLAARLGATAITHTFLPGAILSRRMGREDCLGTTMALRRETLDSLGGLQALVGHLADDNVMGKRVDALGLGTALATTIPSTGVPESDLGALWRHEMRWARTIRALEPLLFAASVLQYPLFWAACGVVASGGAGWAAGLFALAWLVRACGCLAVDRAIGRGRTDAWVLATLPVRDVLSAVQVGVSFLGSRVIWRGHSMHADGGVAACQTSGR